MSAPSIPARGPIVGSFITEFGTGTGAERTLIDNLKAYGTTKSALINGYHAAYEAALEKAIDTKIDAISTTVADVFTFGAILDLTDVVDGQVSILSEATSYLANGPNKFQISWADNFPTTANAKNVGTYYKLLFPAEGNADTKYRVILDSNDVSDGLVVQSGDAVVIYDNGYKRLDRIDNVQTSISADDSGGLTATQDTNSSNYTIDLSQTTKDTLASVPDRDSVNATLTSIIQRLQTVTTFMAFIESSGFFLDSNGNPISFASVMQTIATPVTTGNLLTDNDVVQYPLPVTYTAVSVTGSYYYGDSIEIEISDVAVILSETVLGVYASIDGGRTYEELLQDVNVPTTYSKLFDEAGKTVPYTTAGTRNVSVKVVTNVNAMGYVIPNYTTYTTLDVQLIADVANVNPLVIDSLTQATVTGPFLLANQSGTALTITGFPTQMGIQLAVAPFTRVYFDNAEVNTILTGTTPVQFSDLTLVAGSTYNLFVSDGSSGDADARKFVVSSTISVSVGV